MKNIYSKLLIVAMISSSLVNLGCKKDEATVKNQVTFDSNIFRLKNGYQSLVETITKTPPKSSVYRFDIMLLGSGLTYDEDFENFTGQGDYIFLSMYSLESEFLSPGLYTYDRFASTDSLTIDGGAIGIDNIFDFGLPEDINYITSGVVDVKKRGNNYEIEFEFYTDANKKLVGSYSGLLEDFTIDYGKGTGKFNLQGTDYSLDHGSLTLKTWIHDIEGYAFTLNLYGTGNEELIGDNEYTCTIYSSHYNRLETGKYTFNSSKENFSFNTGQWSIPYTIDNFLSNSWTGFTNSGTLDVTRDGRKYTITLDLMVSNSVIDSMQLTGQYTGYLEYDYWW